MQAKLGTSPYLWLDRLAVAPPHQGEGIGTKLLESGLQIAAEAQLPVRLNADVARTPFYTDRGFRLECETVTPFGIGLNFFIHDFNDQQRKDREFPLMSAMLLPAILMGNAGWQRQQQPRPHENGSSDLRLKHLPATWPTPTWKLIIPARSNSCRSHAFMRLLWSPSLRRRMPPQSLHASGRIWLSILRCLPR